MKLTLTHDRYGTTVELMPDDDTEKAALALVKGGTANLTENGVRIGKNS
ncbi:MAG: hypothetical protein M0R06_06235 [Sphaerochaeta sp.]|jgi:hypothetical protein|nr:hypothetical protein [Sphaerochaeta sp.]